MLRRKGQLRIRSIEAKTMIVNSKLPDIDCVVNPYTGCEFACLYCYASFMGRFVGESNQSWGDYVYVKENAIEIFKNDLNRLLKKNKTPSLLLSSVTDPYQPVEKKYGLTKGILEAIENANYRGKISILTKSPLVLRDVPIFKQINHVEIGMTVTSTENILSKSFEIFAPNLTSRLESLTRLNEQGIETYAFIGPILPHIYFNLDELDRLLNVVAKTGTRSIYVEHINLSSYIKSKILSTYEKNSEVLELYSNVEYYVHELDKVLGQLMKRHGLKLRLSEAIVHKQKELF